VTSKWSSAPGWLRVLCVVGIPWGVAWVAVGVPFLVKEGPGLLFIWLGMLGLAPWLLLALRNEQPPGT
jgi:hypothetical protein